MKTTISLRAVLLLILCGSSTWLKAQHWGLFGPVLSQMDTSMRARYHTNLGVLQNTWKPSIYNFSGVLDSLSIAVNGQNPVNGLGDLLPIWTPAQDSLNVIIGMSDLIPVDSMAILLQFGTLTNTWDSLQNDLLGAFSTYGDQLNTPALPTHYTAPPSTWQPTVDSLTQNQASAFYFNPSQGPGNLQAAMKQLFNPQLFTLLEMFGGRQTTKITYYGTGYVVQVPVIGLRSVEQFNRTWEARWRVQGSWLNHQPNSGSDPVTTQPSKFIPLLLQGNFDVMYIPQIGIVDSKPLHLITLLGIEAGTYAPAHRDPNHPASQQNKGYTTGWGPELGAGLSIKVGNTTIYALGTTAFGDVVCSADFKSDIPYRYRSTHLEAGIIYANLLTLRFDQGLSVNWANAGNKNARYRQLTVGLPTTALFH